MIKPPITSKEFNEEFNRTRPYIVTDSGVLGVVYPNGIQVLNGGAATGVIASNPCHRPATLEDFETFRVMPPPHYKPSFTISYAIRAYPSNDIAGNKVLCLRHKGDDPTMISVHGSEYRKAHPNELEFIRLAREEGVEAAKAFWARTEWISLV